MAHMESLVEVIPSWECPGADVYLELHEQISKENDFPHILLASSLEYLEKWVNHLKIYI